MNGTNWTRFAMRFIGLGIALLTAPTATAAGADDVGVVWDHGKGGERYVALGDSAASGPGIPNQRDDPLACERSDRNFPTVAAEILAVDSFRDVTCGSAVVENMWKPQENPNNIPGVNPRQLDALDRKTTLVTVGPIGANDFNLVGVGLTCLNFSPPPNGTSCKETYTADGSDPNLEAIRKLRPKLDRMMRGINRRAPRADVFVVGYGYYFPPGGCWPYVPVWAEDADYIQSLVDLIDTKLIRAARRGGARYVSLQGHKAVAHTMCAFAGQQWITQLADPLSGVGILAHPTGRGMAAFGEIVAEKVTRSRE